MTNTLYLECYSGISGDMTVAALLDLGADQTVLNQALKSLSVSGFHTRISRVKKAGLDVCDFQVILDEEHENHDHDMEYLYGHEHSHDHGEGHHHHHAHEEEHHHDHEEGHHHHDHGEEHHHHAHEEGHHHDHAELHAHRHEELHTHSHDEHHHGGHVHRGLPEILDIIGKAEISERAKEISERIFTILAEAESKAHGLPIDQVHFHEVGAVDSIVDIVAIAVCLDNLGITSVIVPELYEGRGTVRCQHGVIPVPVPAVVHVAQTHGLHLHFTNVEGELVTPTGAAVVAAVRTSDKLPEKFTVQKIGVGAGKRTYDRPSLLRAMLIESEKSHVANVDCGKPEGACLKDTICKLETNIDDCSGEALGYVMEQLLQDGAKDVWYSPIYMKKNRPAYLLSVLCDVADTEKMEQIIFRETTTIGIRKTQMERTILKRENRLIATSLGQAEVKQCVLPDGEVRCYPEYESASVLARENGISYQETYRKILMEAGERKTLC